MDVTQCVCFNAALSIHPFLSFPYWVPESVLSVCASIAAHWYHLSKSKVLCSRTGCCCHVQFFCDPMDTVARQAPLSMISPRLEYWSELPFPSPEDDLPDSGIQPASPALAGGFFFYHLTTREALKDRHTSKILGLHPHCIRIAQGTSENNLTSLMPVIFTFNWSGVIPHLFKVFQDDPDMHLGLRAITINVWYSCYYY